MVHCYRRIQLPIPNNRTWVKDLLLAPRNVNNVFAAEGCYVCTNPVMYSLLILFSTSLSVSWLDNMHKHYQGEIYLQKLRIRSPVMSIIQCLFRKSRLDCPNVQRSHKKAQTNYKLFHIFNLVLSIILHQCCLFHSIT